MNKKNILICLLALGITEAFAQTNYNYNGNVRAYYDLIAFRHGDIHTDLTVRRNQTIRGWLNLSGANGSGAISAVGNITTSGGYIHAVTGTVRGALLYSDGAVQSATYGTFGSYVSAGTNVTVGNSGAGNFRVIGGRAWIGPTATTGGNGMHALAVGQAATAESYSSVVVGRFNETGGNATTWVATDPLFVVANGADANNRANALTVKKNGDIILGKAQGDILMGDFGQP